MRKITVIALIILVVAIVAGVLLFTYSRDEISYVFDHRADTPSALVVSRLYSSGINEEEVNRLSESLLTTSFTEDELLSAALRAGKPEFYPVFSFQLEKGDDTNSVLLAGKIEQHLFDEQTSADYSFSNLRMEVTSDGAYINEENSVFYGTNADGTKIERATPIIADDGSSLAVQLDAIGAYTIGLEGRSGTVMIQYTFDVITNRALFNNKMLENQILQVYINLNTLEDGSVGATFEVVEASEVSELY